MQGYLCDNGLKQYRRYPNPDKIRQADNAVERRFRPEDIAAGKALGDWDKLIYVGYAVSVGTDILEHDIYAFKPDAMFSEEETKTLAELMEEVVLHTDADQDMLELHLYMNMAETSIRYDDPSLEELQSLIDDIASEQDNGFLGFVCPVQTKPDKNRIVLVNMLDDEWFEI